MIAEEVPQGLPPRTHNLPPDLREQMKIDIDEMLGSAQTPGSLRYRRQELLESLERKQVVDRISAGEATDILSIAGEVGSTVHERRMELTRPLREAADYGKELADAFWEDVEEAMAALRGRLKAWDDAEGVRIADQKAEEAAFMASLRQPVEQPTTRAPMVYDDRAPPAPAPSPAPPPVLPARPKKIRGDLGGTASRVEVTTFTITDITQVPRMFLDSPMVHEAVISAIKAMGKHLPKTIPGVEKTTGTDLRIK